MVYASRKSKNRKPSIPCIPRAQKCYDSINGNNVTVWRGKVTEELRELFHKYMAENSGTPPNGYIEISYESMTYDEFVGFIKEALRRHCDFVGAVDQVERKQGIIW